MFSRTGASQHGRCQRSRWLVPGTIALALTAGPAMGSATAGAAVSPVVRAVAPSASASTAHTASAEAAVTVVKKKRKIRLTPRKRRAINAELVSAGLSKMPARARVVVLKANGSGVVIVKRSSPGTARYPIRDYMPSGFWGDAWTVVKCSASIVMAVVPIYKAYRGVQALGGIKETAELLVKAGNVDDAIAAGGWAAAEVLGVAGIEDACF
jgi:hypothetical protein